MYWLNGCRIRLLLIAFVAAIVISGLSAKADFTFGEPTNLGPPVNSSGSDFCPWLSTDGLSLYFASVDRSRGYGEADIWVSTRETTESEWGEPSNLGPSINTSVYDNTPTLSADELELYFYSFRSNGLGRADIWVTKRNSKDEPWGPAENLGAPVNTAGLEWYPSLSGDGLELYFTSGDPSREPGATFCVTRRQSRDSSWGEPISLGPVINNWPYQVHPSISSDGLLLLFSDAWSSPEQRQGFGWTDLWLSTRNRKDAPWGQPVNLGSPINAQSFDAYGSISPDGTTIYFSSGRYPGRGGTDLWQAPIIPIVDFDGDGKVDRLDVGLLMLNWGTDDSRYDVGPMPWGDGIVDSKDLMVLAEHGAFLAGDVNFDGVVDFLDLAEVAKNWLRQQP